MVRFICKDCDYKFDNPNSSLKECPYCGKNTIAEEQGAQKILEDVKSLLE